MGWLDGQVALITGGGSGIGLAIVTRFIEEGAHVGVMDRFPERVEQLRAEFGESVVAVPGDVTLLADNKRAVEQTAGSFGKLDIFVGNGKKRFVLVDDPDFTASSRPFKARQGQRPFRRCLGSVFGLARLTNFLVWMIVRIPGHINRR